MTENERRAQDTLSKDDIIVRVLVAASMIGSFLTALLIFQT